MKKILVTTFAFAAVMGLAGAASALDGAGSNPLGKAGQMAISGELPFATGTALTLDRSLFTLKKVFDGGHTYFSLRPNADVFVIDGLSVGGAIQIDYHSADDKVGLGIAPRVGYAFNFGGSDFGIWPKIGLDWYKHGDWSGTYLNVFAPFTWTPVDHFYLGLGPSFDFRLSKGSYTAIGLSSTLGGYFDLF